MHKTMNRIKEVLDEKGIKQTWLAERLGKSFSIVLSLIHIYYGPGNVNKALKRAGSNATTYWDIYPYPVSYTHLNPTINALITCCGMRCTIPNTAAAITTPRSAPYFRCLLYTSRCV